jgi:glycosyltransferase involved in cell wall biosynthesis
MKVLALHAFYRMLGGEDVSHRTEMAFLAQSGVEVQEFTVHNDLVGNMTRRQAAGTAIYNRSIREDLARVCRSFAPDLVYVNNTFPGLSASVYSVFLDLRLPVVQVIRNYRQSCLSANLTRGGSTCTACVGRRLKVAGVVHGCYQSSRSASAVALASRLIYDHFQNDRNGVSKYIAVSHYVAETLIQEGISIDRIVERPNLVWPSPPLQLEESGRTRVALFVGRPTADKGFNVLTSAAKQLTGEDVVIWMIGEAPEGSVPANVEYMGNQSSKEVLAYMSRADVVVVPSVWPEPFGRVVIESLAAGTPVIVSDAGGLKEFGIHRPAVNVVETGSETALSRALSRVMKKDEQIMSLCRTTFERHYGADEWLSKTLDVFNSVR